VGLAAALGGLALGSGSIGLAAGPPCALRETFHIGCVTCGFTRALEALARGDLAAATALHPLALPVVVETGLAWGLWGAGLWRGRPLLHGRWVGRAAAATAIAATVVWVARLVTGTLPV
jgi:hypothetical protein